MKHLFLPFFLYSSIFLAQDFLPKSEGQIIHHTAISLAYSEEHEQALWVYYQLSPNMIANGKCERTNDFRPDPSVSTGSSQLADFRGSGYDRGHLAPAADMKFDCRMMSESFYLSNMSPQSPSFNRGGWKRLEGKFRDWTLGYGLLHIVTGPILKNINTFIGGNDVSVPNQFYKILYSPGKKIMMGFILPNEKIEEALIDYQVPVNVIEKETNVDFFSQLDDELEEKLESSKNTSWWWKKEQGKQDQAKKKSSSEVVSSQCLGIAKSTGVQCKNKTLSSNGYCHVHKYQSPDYKAPKKVDYSGRCLATTKAGSQCKRNSQSGRRYCWQH